MEVFLDDNVCPIADASEFARASFYRKTYGLTAAAFVCWAVLEYLLFATGLAVPIVNVTLGGGRWGWLVVLGVYWLGVTLAQKMANDFSVAKQYVGLGIYVVLEALIFVPLIAVVCVRTDQYLNDILLPAGLATLLLIAGLSAVVFMSKTDFSFLRQFVIMASFLAVAAIVVFTIFNIAAGSIFAVAMIVLMSAAILWQTWQIKNTMSEGQHVAAAAICFGSFMTLFWYVIQLFLRRR